MNELAESVARLARQDRRYAVEAYYFVFEALAFAHRALGMGAPRSRAGSGGGAKKGESERHLTGQELCEAIRRFSLEQYGYMAKCVLNSWGVHTTGDFGEIVFNLIRAGHMRKTPEDRREDFDDNFDFDAALMQDFRIAASE